MNTPQGYLLVVEDIPDILKLLDATLTFKGYRVVTARDGQEALDAIQRERPALIITDILMPKMDGFSLVHRLRINPETRKIPVVFLSATYVAPEDKEFALTIGVTRFVEKPVNLGEFLPMIEDVLKQGVSTIQNIDEHDFYEGYRKRLETKLNQKIKQIARDEHLLKTLTSEDEKQSLRGSLHLAINEREEVQKLLDQIHNQIDNTGKPK